MTRIVPVWTMTWAVATALMASMPAGAQEAGGGNQPAGPAIRRPAGVAPGLGDAPAPAPRPLSPAELDELRLRITGGARGTILKPNEIGDLRRTVQEAQGAANFPGRGGRLPTPEPRVLTVSAQTSMSAPETVHLAYGVVSPITFVDGKGNPWPIASVAYDPRLFAQDGTGCGQDVALGAAQVAAASGADRPTSINLMPCRYDTWGNILIRLESFAFPIPLMVLSGSNEKVDIPITVRVAGTSPLVPARPVVEATPHKGRSALPGPPRAPVGLDTTQLLHLFAAGTPPAGAQTLVASSGTQAWMFRERMYVRTPGTLVSPQPVASADGASGFRVYEFLRPVSRLVAERGDGSEIAIAVEF